MAPRTLGLIPARGGSKRIPGKNLVELGGRPLVAHTIACANESTELDRTVVSTDDPDIRETARYVGGSAPFRRPDHLATDTASSEAVVTHALDWFAERGETFDEVVLLQVTSPFREPDDVDGALERLRDTAADSVVSVSPYDHPPQLAVTLDEAGMLDPVDEATVLWDADTTRTQDLEDRLHPNGAVFGATVDAWRATERFYTDRTVGYRMPPERSVDIDDPSDLRLARALHDHLAGTE